ncbi:porin family protein [Flavobacterium sp. JP2137]|uniref:type IX secretion/gliding motility protein PorT/SprT n=1 Tax=Flavobacterium sp. JP2137 TaxID=3414510 RepID=UPI003D2FC71A
MKKFLIIFIVLLGFQGYSQSMFGKKPLLNMEDWDKQRIYWGYFLGFNSYDFKFDYDAAYYENNKNLDVEVRTNIGFNVGLVGNLRLMEYLDLRFEPGLYYSQRDLHFPNITDKGKSNREVSSTYIHFPLLLKFSALRTGNVRPYVLAGYSQSLNLSSNYKAKDDNYEGRFRMKQWTANYELGVGVDLYFEYFKFSPSIRGVFGIDDELIRDNRPESPWTGGIESMKTRGIFVNFTFH